MRGVKCSTGRDVDCDESARPPGERACHLVAGCKPCDATFAIPHAVAGATIVPLGHVVTYQCEQSFALAGGQTFFEGRCAINGHGPDTRIELLPSLLRGCVGWERSPWSACGERCGPSIRKRQVSCSSANETDCDVSLTPPAKEECIDYSGCAPWLQGKWSSCSAVCGPGTQTRSVECPAGSHCDGQSRPGSVCLGGGPLVRLRLRLPAPVAQRQL